MWRCGTLVHRHPRHQRYILMYLTAIERICDSGYLRLTRTLPSGKSTGLAMSASNSSTDRSRPYGRVAVALSPLLFSTLQPILPVYIRHVLAPYTPRAVIHSSCHLLSPLLLGPIALSPSLGAYISRILQSALLWCLPPGTALWAWAYFIVLASARVLTGFLLTRAVGWAAPAWFSHWALYEVSGGFGPGLMAVLAFRGLQGADVPFGLMEGGDRRCSLWGLGLVTLVFCWSEVAPWTYAHAWLGILLLKGGLWVGVRCRAWRGHGTADEQVEEWEVEVLHSSETNDSLSSSDTLIAYDLPKGRTGYTTLPWAHAPLSIILAALAILVPYLATIWDPTPVILPPIPTDGPVLLDILVLTYPRPPNTDVSAQVLNTTITSYLPFLSNDITLAVFTHAADHPAFDRVRDSYILDDGSPSSVGANVHLTFYQDLDGHPKDQSGHFLHLAEAFRWAEEQKGAEWIMLVEDDFPVCDNGWRYIAQVVEQLESDRRQSGRIRYGWVGTGGRYVLFRDYGYMTRLDWPGNDNAAV